MYVIDFEKKNKKRKKEMLCPEGLKPFKTSGGKNTSECKNSLCDQLLTVSSMLSKLMAI